ncbi:MAG TPA: DUF4926 domain-containing protein [Candidatus Limnocylindrales bacterium]|nr:DUF4926 domain-containing protein [Candidatus Limnocylindrales bacterium]
MKYRELDIVVLRRDIPEHRLKAGDHGTIVFVYEPDGVEVEFVLPSGETRAVLTLNISDVAAHPSGAEARD